MTLLNDLPMTQVVEYLHNGNFAIGLTPSEYQAYLNWRETMDIENNKGLNQHIVEALNSPKSERVPESEVDWGV